MDEQNYQNENEKVKGTRKISKRGLIIGLSAVLLAGGGATGFLLANQNDVKAMETGIEQVEVQNPNTSVTPISTNSAQVDKEVSKPAEQSKEIWLDKHKIIVNSDNPTNVSIKAADAAKIALENIKKDTQKEDDDCEVELFHMNTAGTGNSTGIWIGVTVLNDINRYEFRINDSTGEVIKREDYVTLDSKYTWEKTNSTGQTSGEVVINDQKLAAFNKIDANKINVADCEIVEGKNYGIYIKYNSENQTASYENKNGTLTIKVERINKNQRQNNVNAQITITVPKDTKFDSIVYDSSVGDFSMAGFTVNTLKLLQDCGGIQLKDTSYESAEISADCGNASFSGCKMKNTKLSADCGNISLSDCTMSKTDASADCGNIDIKNTNMTDSKMKADCGTIEGIDLISKNLKLSAQYGSIEVVGDLTGTNDLSASMGSITIGCTKDKSQYSYTLSAGSSNVIIDGKSVNKKDAKSQNSSAANTINASAEMGSCLLNFKADPKVQIKASESDDDSWEDNEDNYRDSWDNNMNSYYDDDDDYNDADYDYYDDDFDFDDDFFKDF